MGNKVKTHPILFSTPMVQAILEGRKTQTRRIIKAKFPKDSKFLGHTESKEKGIGYYFCDGTRGNMQGFFPSLNESLYCPYQVGDILWVRETFHTIHDSETHDFLRYGYKADNDYRGALWKPSLFMPKEACRLFLKIKSIRVERLQDISEADAIAEGARDHLKHTDLKILEGLGNWKIPRPFGHHQFGFSSIWCTINGCQNWLENPFVWVYEFERIEKPLNFGV